MPLQLAPWTQLLRRRPGTLLHQRRSEGLPSRHGPWSVTDLAACKGRMRCDCILRTRCTPLPVPPSPFIQHHHITASVHHSSRLAANNAQPPRTPNPPSATLVVAMAPSPTAGPARSSDTTLAPPTRPSSSEAPQSSLQPPQAKNDAYLSDATTRAPSPSPTGVEDEKKGPTPAGSVREGAQEAQDEMEYPTGVSFAFIVVALVLSIFLVSLDMVSLLPLLLCREAYTTR